MDEHTDIVPSAEVSEATEDAPMHTIRFTPLERRAAEAYIILQRRTSRLHYKYIKQEIAREGKG